MIGERFLLLLQFISEYKLHGDVQTEEEFIPGFWVLDMNMFWCEMCVSTPKQNIFTKG